MLADIHRFRSELLTFGERCADPLDGFFGPASVSWRVNREALLLLGGMRALLLQIAHPKVARGVVDHSRFRQAPLARALRTFRAVHGIVFGTRSEAVEQAVKVYAVHQRVRGTTGSGEAYDASDPELLLWVYATLVDSAVVSYELFFTALSTAEKERLYQEGKCFARLFGLSENRMPPTWGDFQRWLADTVAGPSISVTRDAREIARALLAGRWWLRLIGPVNAALAAGTLDPKLRRGFGLRWSTSVRVKFWLSVKLIRLLARVTPRRLRWLPAAQQALRRTARR